MLTKLTQIIDRLMSMCVPMQHRTAWIEAKKTIESSEDDSEKMLLTEESLDLLSCVTANNPASDTADKLRQTVSIVIGKRIAEAEKRAAEAEQLALEQEIVQTEEIKEEPLTEGIATDTEEDVVSSNNVA